MIQGHSQPTMTTAAGKSSCPSRVSTSDVPAMKRSSTPRSYFMERMDRQSALQISSPWYYTLLPMVLHPVGSLSSTLVIREKLLSSWSPASREACSMAPLAWLELKLTPAQGQQMTPAAMLKVAQ